jgi:hypothetical protein
VNIRISPSQINTFLNEPAIWVLNKFFGIYGDMGAAAKRGNAVELGLNMILLNGVDFDTAVARSLDIYDQEMATIEDEKKEKQRELISPMIKQATELFLNLEPIQKTQIRLEPTILDLPVLGIADYDMGEYLIDLKTTERCPSSNESVSVEHIRQVSLYNMATKKRQKLAYVTDKKYAVHEITQDQMNKAIKEIHAAARAMKAAYDIEEKQGKEALTVLYPPRDTSSFYWDIKTLNAAQGIWF